VTCGKTGWCLTRLHDTCPVEYWAWDVMVKCSCECHREEAA